MRTKLSTVVVLGLLPACSHNLDRVQDPPTSAVVTTAGPNHSMIYLARVDEGVVAVDLGWFGAAGALEEGLARLEADTGDVIAVFLTHSHRDHIAAWPLVRGATFIMAAGEVGRFTGTDEHQGWVPRAAATLLPARLPAAGELVIHAFDHDTAFVFGADTVFAFTLPGHTSGSAAYLVGEVLFLGDALSRSPFAGYVTAKKPYSDDSALSRRALAALFERLHPFAVRWACSAHGDCARYDEAFRADVLGVRPPR